MSSERKTFDVRSGRNAEFFRCDRPWAAISISSPAGDLPVLNEQNRIGLLQLVFDDTSDPNAAGAFNQSLAHEIIFFVRELWEEVDVFSIHCEVGLSRSPAVAAALSRIFYGDDGPWLDFDFPNPLVYRLLVDAALRRSVSGE